jgi:hypothetical protein
MGSCLDAHRWFSNYSFDGEYACLWQVIISILFICSHERHNAHVSFQMNTETTPAPSSSANAPLWIVLASLTNVQPVTSDVRPVPTSYARPVTSDVRPVPTSFARPITSDVRPVPTSIVSSVVPLPQPSPDIPDIPDNDKFITTRMPAAIIGALLASSLILFWCWWLIFYRTSPLVKRKVLKKRAEEQRRLRMDEIRMTTRWEITTESGVVRGERCA